MNEQLLMAKMDKLNNRLQLYIKKLTTMGLNDDELDKYYTMLAEFLQTKLSLNDYLFDKYILPFGLYDEATKYYHEFASTLKWKSELLIKQEQMDVVFEAFKQIDNKTKLLDDLEEYYSLLCDNLYNYYESLENKHVFDDVCLLLSNEESTDFNSIIDYIDYKFEVLYLVLTEGIEKDEKIDETS